MRHFAYTALIPLFLLSCARMQAQRPLQSRKDARAACGPLADQAFPCPRYGFSYKVPFGWVDRTKDMQAEPEVEAEPDSAADTRRNAKPPEKGSFEKGETLLAVFARPPGASGEIVDSAVVIVAESAAGYPEVKTAADYFGPITDLAQQRGFTVANDPYEFRVGMKRLVRSDFSQQAGKLSMWQSSLVMIDKGEIVSFTFLGNTEDEVNELLENLTFRSTAGRKR